MFGRPHTHLPALESSPFSVAPGGEELLCPGKVTAMGWRALRHPTQVSGGVLPTQAQVVQAVEATRLSLLETHMETWEAEAQGAGND